MTRISVSLEDTLAQAVKMAAGGDGKVSKWVASLIHERLLDEAGAQAGAYDRSSVADDDAAWEAERLSGRA